MGVPIPLLPLGARVRVRRVTWPLEAGVEGREGAVTDASEHRPHRYGVMLDDEARVRYFRPEELETIVAPALPRDAIDARRRRALP